MVKKMRSYKVELPKNLFKFLGMLVISLGVFIFVVSLLAKESLTLCFSLLGIIGDMGVILLITPEIWKVYVSQEGLEKKFLWKKTKYAFADIGYVVIKQNQDLHIYSKQGHKLLVDRMCVNYEKLKKTLQETGHIRWIDENNPEVAETFRVQPPRYEKIAYAVIILPNCFILLCLGFFMGIIAIIMALCLLNYEQQYIDVDVKRQCIVIKRNFKKITYSFEQLGSLKTEPNIFSPVGQNFVYATMYDMNDKKLFKIKTQDRNFIAFQKVFMTNRRE